MHHNYLICDPILIIESVSESLNSWDDINFRIGIRYKNRNSDKNRKIYIPGYVDIPEDAARNIQAPAAHTYEEIKETKV